MTDTNKYFDSVSEQLEVQALNIRLPEYVAHDPECWLAQIESQFDLGRITSQTTKYRYLVSAIPKCLVSDLRDLIITPPASAPYDTLKTAILKRNSPSEPAKLEALLHGLQLDDRTPSQLLRLMRQVAGNFANDESLLKHIWLKRMPTSVTSVLAMLVDTATLDHLAASADTIMDYIPPSSRLIANTTHVPSTSTSPNIHDLYKCIEQLQISVNSIKADNQRLRERSRSRSRSNSRSRKPNNPAFCYYHNRFGSHARKCEQPCNFEKPQGNSQAKQ